MIAVIGGTGKSGRFVVRELIRQNIPFRILLRSATTYEHTTGDIIRGDVRDPAAVLELIRGATAIISTLGQPKGEPAIFSQATRNILAAMRETNIHRYILTTGLNVDTPGDAKGPRTKAGTLWMREHYPETTADKQREYELLAAADIDWTLVRLPMIGLTAESAHIATSLEDCPGMQIHGTDLARFLIHQVSTSDYIRKAPFLANPDH